MRGLIGDILKIYGVSAVFGFVPSILTIFLGMMTADESESIWWNVVFWNLYFAGRLHKGGLLPACNDCGLFTVIVPLLYLIAVGVLGYAFIIAPFWAYVSLSKKDKLP